MKNLSEYVKKSIKLLNNAQQNIEQSNSTNDTNCSGTWKNRINYIRCVFKYPRENLKDLYKIGDIIRTLVVYVCDADQLTFYIIDISNPQISIIADVNLANLSRYNDIPPAHDVFGLLYDDYIIRAVRSTLSIPDSKFNSEWWSCYTMDFGELIKLRKLDITYKLSPKKQIIPAQGIFCKLTGIKFQGKLYNIIDLKKLNCDLLTIEFRSVVIKIVSVESDFLQVIIDKDYSNTYPEDNGRIDFNTNYIPKERLRILFDEPLCSTNLMKAVVGYETNDAKRLCRFYNQKINGCFKGSKCEKEHIPQKCNVWTTDMAPAVSAAYTAEPLVMYTEGTMIEILPTSINSLDYFYAQIIHFKDFNDRFIFNDEDILPWKLLERPPYLYDIVLAQYTDGFWYRAQIMEHDDEYSAFKVFYVDYGNEQILPLDHLAKCNSSINRQPFLAVQCRIANIKINKIDKEKHKSIVDHLRIAILNQVIKVRVDHHFEDLFISFADKRLKFLVDDLIQCGFLENN